MSDLHKAAAAALEALEGVLDTYGEPLDLLSISGGTYEALQCRDAITALRAALTQSERDWSLLEATQESLREHMAEIQRLQRLQRKPLTEEEITQCFKEAGITIKGQRWTNAVRNVERAHGIGGEA